MDFLAAIPAPVHPPAHNLWYPSTLSQAFTFAPSNANTFNSQSSSQQAQQAQAQQSQQRQSHRNAQRTFMTHLRLDENAIAIRRANIRRFGAGWLRPPGISKTMQGLWDERAEREEAEVAAQREMAMAEAQAAAEALAIGEQGGQEEEAQGEHDLDDDIPEAEEDGADWSSSDEEDDDALPMNEIDGDFGPDGTRRSIVENVPFDMLDRNLDDDVPEAGSYQHTDTDIEDSSSVLDDEVERGRTSLGMASFVSHTGFGSSPLPPSRAPGR